MIAQPLLHKINLCRERLFFSHIFNIYLAKNEKVECILKYNRNDLNQSCFIYGEERGLPGDHINDTWWKMMFMRYALAIHFSNDKKVLESCSGLGWGAFLLEDICHSLTCIEIDQKSIEISQQLWPYKKTKFIKGSVLSMPFDNNSFDVVCAMESIEHFTLQNIEKYLNEMARVLKPGGVLVGSSYFPDTLEEAEKICSENKYHLHICTKDEITELLRKKFKKIKIFENRCFFWGVK